jgi:hypothetical protein
MTGDNSWRRLRRVFRRDPAKEIGSELDHHVEERVRDYITRGMSPEEARRAALERVGDVDAVRSECVELLADERRNEERRIHLNVSWLDVKLGVRMLLKYPGLSAVSVIGMAVAIAVRTALGASRRRVLTQLFIEGLVLSVAAAVVGLTVTGIALGRVETVLENTTGGELPFWWSLARSPLLIAYVRDTRRGRWRDRRCASRAQGNWPAHPDGPAAARRAAARGCSSDAPGQCSSSRRSLSQWRYCRRPCSGRAHWFRSEQAIRALQLTSSSAHSCRSNARKRRRARTPRSMNAHSRHASRIVVWNCCVV